MAKPRARPPESGELYPIEQARHDRLRALNPYRTAPAAAPRSGTAPRPPQPRPRFNYEMDLPPDMAELQRALIGDVIGGRVDCAAALDQWRAAVGRRQRACRVRAKRVA